MSGRARILTAMLLEAGLGIAVAAGAIPSGIVVEAVEPGLAAASAGLAPEDHLLSWRRRGASLEGETTQGELRSPFDLEWVELEQAPREEISITVSRGSEVFDLSLPAGKWGVTVRPPLSEADLELYLEGERRFAAGDAIAGLARWHELVRRLEVGREHMAAAWLDSRIARFHAERGAWASARSAFELAIRAAEEVGDTAAAALVYDQLGKILGGDGQLAAAVEAHEAALTLRRRRQEVSLGVARSHNLLGVLHGRQDRLDVAEKDFRRALEIAELLAPGSLVVAVSLNNLGVVARRRGDLEAAEELFRRDLEITETWLPDSLGLATSLNNLGNVVARRGDLATAEALYRRALELRERHGSGSAAVAGNLRSLAGVAWKRGDLLAAEDLFRRSLDLEEALAPDTLAVASSLSGLGAMAFERGDLEAAAEYHRRAAEIQERRAPGGSDLADSLNNLGDVALEHGELEAAESFHRRSLEIRQHLAPESLRVAVSLDNLADVALRRGELESAESLYRRALALRDRLAPESLEVAVSLHHLGDLARRGGDIATAEAVYRRALAIRESLAPGSAAVAESLYRLATLERQRRKTETAMELYRRALEALEEQRGRWGGSDQVRSRFAARFAPYYFDALSLLVELGRSEEAFGVLERYRARSFLALLAERDLGFGGEVSPQLERERRLANGRHDRVARELAGLSGDVESSRLEDLRRQLLAARLEQDAVAAKIRAASPRRASIEDPQPLDLAAARDLLDPGTLVLSYAVGPERSYLFLLGPERDEFSVHLLEIGQQELRREMTDFRDALLRGRVDPRPERALLFARRLTELLLAPAARRIADAERLLVIPDGPLHLLPFAALADPTTPGGHRWLVEAKPSFVAASLTVLAELRQRSRHRPTSRLTAFGDPEYPAGGDEASGEPRLRAALRQGFHFRPLPATRGEVEGLRALFPDTSRIFLGAEASETNAKRLATGAELVHFACHGLIDDRSPLDSALALSIPRGWRDGQENGLLQAWEIFEQLRLDADLVTLSACDTGAGEVVAGEGILSLSRAFQYAGAQTVLASLWSVDDGSTGELMAHFYARLKRGESKAGALRRAQIDLLRQPEFAHPFHWAGFQLFGEWRLGAEMALSPAGGTQGKVEGGHR